MLTRKVKKVLVLILLVIVAVIIILITYSLWLMSSPIVINTIPVKPTFTEVNEFVVSKDGKYVLILRNQDIYKTGTFDPLPELILLSNGEFSIIRTLGSKSSTIGSESELYIGDNYFGVYFKETPYPELVEEDGFCNFFNFGVQSVLNSFVDSKDECSQKFLEIDNMQVNESSNEFLFKGVAVKVFEEKLKRPGNGLFIGETTKTTIEISENIYQIGRRYYPSENKYHFTSTGEFVAKLGLDLYLIPLVD